MPDTIFPQNVFAVKESSNQGVSIFGNPLIVHIFSIALKMEI